ncbi:hypothetical protein QPF19_004384 [Salmonella enterica]|nr:hypothetical protein [Salmonella enterica]
MKETELKPRNLSAAVRTRLDEIEGWLNKGIGRQEIAQILDAEYSFSVTPKAFEMALYRARQKRKSGLHNTQTTIPNAGESVLHNTQKQEEADSVLHNTQGAVSEDETKKIEKPEIIGKEFFDQAKAEFDPSEFIKKY